MILAIKKGVSLMGLLISLSIFSGLFLTLNQWKSSQQKRAVQIYQTFQAVQIAENAKQRQRFNLSCEPQIKQNGLTFHINCQTGKVSFPLGEITL